MPQYIYEIFCWNANISTGVTKKLVLFGTTATEARQHFIDNYDRYSHLNPHFLFGYKNYRYVYRYEYEPTGIYDSRNHMIYRPLYHYEYSDLLTLVCEREPSAAIQEDILVL